MSLIILEYGELEKYLVEVVWIEPLQRYTTGCTSMTTV
jgi:hypothetical protein